MSATTIPESLWSPTCAPLRDDEGGYVARHGRGYSRFEHAVDELTLDLLEYVPLDDPIKISRLTIRNTGRRPRRFTVTAYVAWVLGASRAAAAPYTITAIDEHYRGDVRSQSLGRGFRGPGRIHRHERPPDQLDRRSPRVHRSQRDARKSRRAFGQRRRCPTVSAQASIPAAPCRPRSSLLRTTASNSPSSLARARAPTKPGHWSSAIAPPISTRCSPR